ncbi:MAG: hypothetical protein NTV51_08005 [Verrucomicrobia bacterium]|nr:hypothetical protein [Verrucomicrobiota bacterium]
MKAPPLLPEEIFQRVLRVARFDGWSVVGVAGVFALLAGAMGDYVGAAIGLLVAGAGAIELHGVTLLRHGEPTGMRWLVGSQFFLMASILGYCALRLAHPEYAALKAAMTDEIKAQLDVLGMSVDEFLRQFYRLVYLAVAFVTVLYQGGMALWYLGKRTAVAAALAPEPE